MRTFQPLDDAGFGAVALAGDLCGTSPLDVALIKQVGIYCRQLCEYGTSAYNVWGGRPGFIRETVEELSSYGLGGWVHDTGLNADPETGGRLVFNRRICMYW